MSAALDLTPDNLVLREQPSAGVARLTLNRPKAYNSLSSGLMAALQADPGVGRRKRSQRRDVRPDDRG